MKRCPNCQTTFPDDANFCPMDAGRLVDDAPQADSAKGEHNLVGGRFQLGALLGGKRTGEVHSVRDVTNGQECVVKLVAPSVFPSPLAVQRAERELKQLQKVVSERIAKILDFGKHGNSFYITMERVNGTPLSQVIRAGGPLALERARKVTSEIGEALAEAAKSGVIHRDVAPKNVILGDGDRVKLINFVTPVPVNDKVFGVPEFVSPEQAEGKSVDQRANIYSLGALLYFMLTGECVFSGDAESVIQAHLQSPVSPPSSRGRGAVPAEVEKAILKALEKQSSRRHLTLRQMLGEIDTAVESSAASSDGNSPAQAARAPNPNNMTLMGVAMFGSVSPLPGPKTDVVNTPPSPSVGVAPQVAAPQPAPPAATAAAAAPSSSLATAAAAPSPVAWAPSAPTPFVPAPAAPVAAVQGAAPSGKGKGKANAGTPAAPPAAEKGKFRETMWFKKGELDEAAAALAATAPASSDAPPVSDKVDELPIEDRYKDDGTLTAADRERLSLRTGATQMMQAVSVPVGPVPGERMGEKEIVSELRAGRTKIIAIIVAAVIVIGGVVAFFSAGGKQAESKADAAPGLDQPQDPAQK
ncbi:MAG: serine/threonine protein kinase [Deltaproteobacteria bacterium]|nr:serine/threonine protein kinase [Deltaproteobacteria bacterium]